MEIPQAGQPRARTGLTAGYVLIAMGFGAIAAIPAIIFEGAGEFGVFLISTGAPDIVTAISVVAIAPLVEEVVKPLGLYLIGIDQRPALTLKEWAILGFLAGLAFSLLEDALYIFLYTGLPLGSAGMLATAAIRLPVPVHMIGTTLTGFGVGMWYQSKRIAPFIMALALAMLVHAFWNSMIFG